MVKILQYKNKYNYTINQLYIDYENMTYEIGSFKIGADKTVTKKAFYKKIEELIILGFKEKIR